MNQQLVRWLSLLFLMSIQPVLASTPQDDSPASATVSAKAQTLHEQLLTLDSHMDIALHLARPDWDILKQHRYANDFSQVDLPRIQQGGLKGGFWAIYTPQGARTPTQNVRATEQALAIAVQIQDVARRYPQYFALATDSAQIRQNAQQGKFSIILSMENASPVANHPEKQLAIFERLGLRMLGLVHTKNNDFADSSTDKAEWHGLSPAGRKLVQQANCLGIIVDVSHASDDALDQVLQLSKAPIIASHSSSKAIYDHPRNLDDVRIKQLAAQGGLIQLNTYPSYLSKIELPAEKQAAQKQIFAAFKQPALLDQKTIDGLVKQQVELDRKYPPAQHPNVDDFMRHLLHVLKLVGPEHVGIGADWDGGGGVNGLNDVSDIPKITERLLAAGYSEKDIKNIWGENLLRVLDQAQQVGLQCQSTKELKPQGIAQ